MFGYPDLIDGYIGIDEHFEAAWSEFCIDCIYSLVMESCSLDRLRHLMDAYVGLDYD